jgi:hypothetical protein
MASGWFTRSPVLDQRAGSGLPLPASDEEHVALLGKPEEFDRLLRKDDLLDDGVAGIFSLAGAIAELVGLCFHAAQFTSAEAATWLAERGFTPLLFISKSGEDHR